MSGGRYPSFRSMHCSTSDARRNHPTADPRPPTPDHPTTRPRPPDLRTTRTPNTDPRTPDPRTRDQLRLAERNPRQRAVAAAMFQDSSKRPACDKRTIVALRVCGAGRQLRDQAPHCITGRSQGKSVSAASQETHGPIRAPLSMLPRLLVALPRLSQHLPGSAQY